MEETFIYYVWDFILSILSTFIVITAALISFCCKGRCGKDIEVKALCADSNFAYKEYFQRFIKSEVGLKINWIFKKSQTDIKGKVLLFLDVRTRIPEDLQWALEKFGFEEKVLCENILVVAMHQSESGIGNSVSNFIGDPDHPLHHYRLTNIFCSGKLIPNDPENEKAKTIIKNFLSP